MGTLIVWSVCIILAIVLLALAFRAAGAGIKSYGVVTRGVMDLMGVRLVPGQSRRERIGMVVMGVIIMAGVASCAFLAVRWLIT